MSKESNQKVWAKDLDGDLQEIEWMSQDIRKFYLEDGNKLSYEVVESAKKAWQVLADTHLELLRKKNN
jgi:hypothetical protein